MTRVGTTRTTTITIYCLLLMQRAGSGFKGLGRTCGFKV